MRVTPSFSCLEQSLGGFLVDIVASRRERELTAESQGGDEELLPSC